MTRQPSSITLTRNGVNVHPPYYLSPRPTLAAEQIRTVFTGLWDEVEDTDVFICAGRADFGRSRELVLPSCTFRSVSRANPARWTTDVRIDGSTLDGYTKGDATPGFCLGTFQRFENFYLGGVCWDADEDGGLMGWKGENNDPGELELVNCEIDSSRHDWGIYSWENTTRSVTMTGGIGRFCRQFISLAGGGGGADQTIIVSGTRFYGDANGSTSLGTSSGPSPDTGGVLTVAVNKLGSTTLTDCEVDVIGQRVVYAGGAYGCPRIAALGTNWYFSGSGTVDFTFTRCKINYTPGI